MASLTKSTHTFATHQIPLECDVYEAADYPADSPVFLFFHSGALAGGSREDVHPWMAQMCLKRKWPLVSASYRLIPQVDGEGLLDDAKAAYDFARNLGGGVERRVIVGGASAGFFLATLVAHHLTPKPLALLSITGIPSFHHPFFNSSTLIPPSPIKEEDIERFVAESVSVGNSPPNIFYVDMLQPSSSKNPQFQAPPKPPNMRDPSRGLLYDYYVYENQYVPLIGSVDPGFDWAEDPAQASRLARWPVTVFIQGDEDDDVNIDVCASVAKRLGDKKAKFCVAKGQGHLFEGTMFIEDDLPGMDAVRQAIDELDKAVAVALNA